MTGLEIQDAMAKIAADYAADADSRLKALPADAKREKKAIIIEREMYNLCSRAGLLYYAKNAKSEDHLHWVCGFLLKFLAPYPKTAVLFAEADDETKLKLAPYLRGVIFMDDQYLKPNRAALAKAEEAGDAEEIFELRIKVGAVAKVIDAWRSWWKKNGIVELDV